MYGCLIFFALCLVSTILCLLESVCYFRTLAFGRIFCPVCLLIYKTNAWFAEIHGLEIDYEMPQFDKQKIFLKDKGGKLRPGSCVRLVNFLYWFQQKITYCMFRSITRLGLLIQTWGSSFKVYPVSIGFQFTFFRFLEHCW